LNRAFIYGDLLFETIKVENGRPLLASLHYTRLMDSARLLKFETDLTLDGFVRAIEAALGESKEVRVRFTLYRNAEGFYTPLTNGTAYEIEVFPLPEKKKNGISLGLYTDSYKPCHELSNIKSGNALVYVMAGIWARENGYDDALILNEHGCVCEAVSSNVFIVKENKVYTPALMEGCVDGVMRRHVLEQLKQGEYEIAETVISVEQLQSADSVFLTNALNGLISVYSFGDKKYSLEHAGISL
jgi:branched-chain amino acid aminotransferase